MIAETIKKLHSAHWYGCGSTIEIAKGKNAIPENWKEVKEKIRRARHAEAVKAQEQNYSFIKKIRSWLLRKNLT